MVTAFGRNLRAGFEIHHLYILYPDDLAAWAKPFKSRFAAHLAKTDWLRALVHASGGNASDLAHLNLLSERALPINNLKVSLAYCRTHGTALPPPHAAMLEAFVRRRPLAGR